MTSTSESEIKAAVDAVLARAGLPVTPEDYVRLLGLYPALQAQAAALRLPELRDLEPAVIYPAQSSR
jgi:hypothetical protein